MLKKAAFVVGVAVGLFNLATTATMILTYYFTGRIPSVVVTRDADGARRPRLALLTVDERVEQARERVHRRFEEETST